MKSKLLLCLFASIFTFGTALQAATFYIKSPKAKLLSEPNMKASGSALTMGSAVTQIGKQGLFLKVRAGNQTGWVSKLFLSTLPPSGKVSFGSSISQNTSAKARARASSYTQTAAARGLTESEQLRTRGRKHEYDFESVEWLEQFTIPEHEIQNFLEADE